MDRCVLHTAPHDQCRALAIRQEPSRRTAPMGELGSLRQAFTDPVSSSRTRSPGPVSARCAHSNTSPSWLKTTTWREELTSCSNSSNAMVRCVSL